jgi:hypothetical protein
MPDGDFFTVTEAIKHGDPVSNATTPTNGVWMAVDHYGEGTIHIQIIGTGTGVLCGAGTATKPLDTEHHVPLVTFNTPGAFIVPMPIPLPRFIKMRVTAVSGLVSANITLRARWRPR